MAAFDFAEMQDVATELIEDFGRDMTITMRDRTVADAAKPWEGPASPGDDTSFVVKGVVIEFDEKDVPQLGTLVQEGEKKILISARAAETANAGTIPLMEDFDTVLDGEIVWRINRVTVVEPGPLRLLYELRVVK